MTDVLPEDESVLHSIKMIQKIIADKGEMQYDHSRINKKIDLLPQEAYNKVENFVEQFIALDIQETKESAFKVFMDRMNAAEKSVQEKGYYFEEEANNE